MSDDGFPRPCEVLVEGEWLPATLYVGIAGRTDRFGVPSSFAA